MPAFARSVLLLRHIAALRESGLADSYCGLLKDLVINEDERIHEAAEAFLEDGDDEVFMDWLLHLCGIRGDRSDEGKEKEAEEDEEDDEIDAAEASAKREAMAQVMMEVQRQKRELQDKMDR